MSMSINQCDQEIEKITPPTGKLEVTENGTYGVSGYYEVEVNVSGGGGDCPDLSEDTVTPEKLLSGYTAHDAEGDEIVGTLTGDDFITASLSITNDFPSNGFQLYSVPSWNASTQILEGKNVNLPPQTTTTVSILRGMNVMYFSSSVSVEFSNMSSGVTLVNNGDPVHMGGGGTTDFYIFRVTATNTARSLTISPKS